MESKASYIYIYILKQSFYEAHNDMGTIKQLIQQQQHELMRKNRNVSGDN